MDKNMINIDDLLRQRLSGGEEKERPGAWLQMRDLLDKEMPATRPVPGASVNWRRMFGYLSGLLLLATVSIGGYQMATSMRDNNDLASAAANSQHTPASSAANVSPVTNGNNIIGHKAQSENTEISNTNNNTASDNIAQSNKANTTVSNSPSVATSSTASAAHISGSDNGSFEGKTQQNATKRNNNAISVGSDNDLNISKNHQDTKANASGSIQNSTVAKNTPAETNKDRVFGGGNKATASKLTNVALNDGHGGANGKSSVNTGNSVTNSNKITPAAPAVAPTQAPDVKPKVQPDYTVGKQLVDKIETKETYSKKTGWKKDTIAVGKAELDVLIPAEPVMAMNKPVTENKPAANTDIVPASAMSLSANNEAASENMLPLSNFKVSSKQNHYSKTNMLEQMIQNAKMNLGGAKFYGGIIGGINTSLTGRNSMAGFQFGFTGNLSLNEHWGILSELKYVQRFNNKMLENNYVKNLDSGMVSGQKVYTWDSVNHSFNFPTAASFELPVYLRYSLNRFNLHAGVNIAYQLTINNLDEKSTDIRVTNNEGPAVLSGNVNYRWKNGIPVITVDDFASRLSLGYMFGVGYQLTPAIQFDVRMTQALWDNAKTEGAKEVSYKLYKAPAMQLNMSYRFSSNKFRPHRR